MKEHRLAETRLTPLFVRSGHPLMWLTSAPTRPVIFPVFLLNPVNCTVAPSTESIRDPAKPPNRPASQAFVQQFQPSILEDVPRYLLGILM